MSAVTVDAPRVPKTRKTWRQILKSLWVGAKMAARRAGSQAKSAAKTGWRFFIGLLRKAPEALMRAVRVADAVGWFGAAVVLSLALAVALFIFGVGYQLYFSMKWLFSTRARMSLREYADRSEGLYGFGYDSIIDWDGFLRGAARAEEKGHIMPSGEFIEEGHVDVEEAEREPLSEAEQVQVALEFGRKLPVPVPEGVASSISDLLVIYETAAEYCKSNKDAHGYAYWKARAVTRTSHGEVDPKKALAVIYRQSRDFWHPASATEGLNDETNLISHQVAA